MFATISPPPDAERIAKVRRAIEDAFDHQLERDADRELMARFMRSTDGEQ